MKHIKAEKALTLSELATLLNAEVIGDPHLLVQGIGTETNAAAGQVVLAEDERKLAQALANGATILLIPRKLQDQIPEGPKGVLVVEHGRLALIKILTYFGPKYELPTGVHPTAAVSPNAKLGRDVRVSAGAVIEDGAEVGDGTWIYPNVYIGPDSKVGSNSIIYANVVIRDRVIIGQRAIIHPGAVIGSDGFGFVTANGMHHKVPHIGMVEIGDDVEIGSNTTIDRATMGKTVIGSGTKIDNLVQIGHNVQLGAHNLLAGMAGVAGSSITEDYVTLAGQSGLGGHLTVASGTVVGAGAIVANDIKEPGFVSGIPARPHREEMKVKATMRRVPDLIQREKELERRVAQLEEMVEKLSAQAR